jgi:hypothetical protein
VVVCGEELLTYLMKKEGRQYLHPELQAELRFGMDQSTAVVQEEFRENFELFLRQGSEWAAADEEIVGLRATCFQQPLPCLEILRRTASLEVECVEAAWRGNFLGALERCRAILAELAGPELRGYAAFWNYVAGCAAWLATQHGMAAL